MARIDVALVYTDGRREVVAAGRPADLIAFADKFGKIAPTEPHAIAELAWLVHHALRLEQPLEAWLDTVEELTADPEEVEAIREGKATGTDPTESPGTPADPEPEPEATVAMLPTRSESELPGWQSQPG